MLDPSIGFNSAVNGFASNSTSSGEKNAAEKPKVKVFRYPYNLKIDRDTDYLEIKIADYQPPGLSLPELKSKNNQLLREGDEGENNPLDLGGFDFNAPTGTETNRSSLKKPKAYISLPIPQSLSDTAQVTWGEDTLDPLSAFAVGMGSNLLSGTLDVKTEAEKLFKSARLGLSEAEKKAAIAVISGKAYGALGGNVSITGLISRASGRVLNPNLELLFQGVTLRSFPFTFDFVPRNSAEARAVKNIIRTFKQSMTAKSSSSSTPAGIFIGAPDVFQLTYKRGPNAHPFLNKFKPMALTSMQLNYTGSNTYATYADGTPVHINMSLTFTELNPIYAEDYRENDIGVGY